MRKYITLLSLGLIMAQFLLGCSTIRMNYKGDFKTADGRTGVVEAQKSYAIPSSHSTMCIITGIFFGGYCWYYTVMPTTQQRLTMQQDVLQALKVKLSTNELNLVTLYNDKENWSQGENTLSLKPASSSGFDAAQTEAP